MRRLYKYIASIIISGIFFLVPIGIIFIIFEKLFHFTQRLQVALHLDIAEKDLLDRIENNSIVIIFLLLLCFSAGTLAKFRLGKLLITSIENNVLLHLPGYNYLKVTAQDLLGVAEHNTFQKVVLYRDDTGKYQFGFEIEPVTDIMIMVFMPSAPKPSDGEMLIVNKERLIYTDLTMHQAFTIIKSMGAGGPALLSKYFNESNSG